MARRLTDRVNHFLSKANKATREGRDDDSDYWFKRAMNLMKWWERSYFGSSRRCRPSSDGLHVELSGEQI